MANDDTRVGAARGRASGLPTPPPSPRANSHDVAREKRDFLPPAAKVSDPAGTKYVPFGPGTPAWKATGKTVKAK